MHFKSSLSKIFSKEPFYWQRHFQNRESVAPVADLLHDDYMAMDADSASTNKTKKKSKKKKHRSSTESSKQKKSKGIWLLL